MRTSLLILVCALGTLQVITFFVDAISPVFALGAFG